MLPDGSGPTLATDRLLLRPWREEDLAGYAKINADPRVMEFFPNVLDRAESDARAGRIRAEFERHGFGLWATQVIGGAEFIGFVGLSVQTFDAPFIPCVEVAWRLACEHWGKGYVTEAARRVLRFAFEELSLNEVVSFTVPANVRSWRVMERIGMRRREAEDFDHPLLPAGHALRRHVLYRLSRPDWLGANRPASLRFHGVTPTSDARCPRH